VSFQVPGQRCNGQRWNSAFCRQRVPDHCAGDGRIVRHLGCGVIYNHCCKRTAECDDERILRVWQQVGILWGTVQTPKVLCLFCQPLRSVTLLFVCELKQFQPLALIDQATTQLSAERPKTVGALDMGGASTQITFVPGNPAKIPPGYNQSLVLYGTEYEMYTYSYLCSGLNEAYRRYLAHLVQVSCDILRKSDCVIEFVDLFLVRSTPPSRPNDIRGDLKCPSTKSFPISVKFGM